MNFKKEIIIRNVATKKDFSYSKGNCSLTFTLSVDVKKEVKDFRELLLKAVEDIDETLKQYV